MKDLNGIIKNAIKKALTEQSNAEEVTVTAKRNPNSKPPEYRNNFETFISPDGRTIMVPYDLDAMVEKFSKSNYQDLILDTERLQKMYSNYTTSNEDNYAKSCNDWYFKDLMGGFDKVAKDYIEIIPIGDKRNWPSDLDQMDGQRYYYILSKLRQYHPEGVKPEHFKGFDYYFKKMSEWLKKEPLYKDIVLVKGSKNPEQLVNVAEYNDAEKDLPTNWYPGDNGIELGGRVIPLSELYPLSWWDWSLTNNKYCETQGSWINFYNEISLFSDYLIDDSVRSMSVLKSELLKYYKGKTELKGDWDIDPKDTNKVIFTACFTKDPKGENSPKFRGYYSYTKAKLNTTAGKLNSGECSGTLFPTMAMFLNANDIQLYTDIGDKIDYNINSVVSIPLSDIADTVGPMGKVFKGKTSRDKRYEKGHDWFWAGTEGGADFRDDMGDFITWVWDHTDDFLTLGTSELINPSDSRKSTDANAFQTKESFTIKTPLNGITKGLFKSTDYIDTTMVNEDTEVWKIPKGGLSPFIPGAVKPKKYGQPDWNYYYIKYHNPSNDINVRLPLPPPSFWDEYSNYYYKLRNIITGTWMEETSSEFGLVLTIVGDSNFNLVIETKGVAGWTLKIDNNSGGMYFSSSNKELSSEVKAKMDKNNGFHSDGTWGSPQSMESYNFRNPTNLDNRSGFDGFWDSHWGTIVTTVAGIAISFIAAPLALNLAVALEWGTVEAGLFVLAEGAPNIAGVLMADGAFTVPRFATLIEVITDTTILGLPGAASYWHRGETLAGWFTLLCSMIPFVTNRTSFNKWSRKVWTKSVGESLNSKIINMGPEYFGKQLTVKKLSSFLSGLNRNERAAFGELMEKLSTNEGQQIMKDTFTESLNYITMVVEKWPKIKKLTSRSLKHNVLTFGKSLGSVGGGIFLSQVTIKWMVDYFNDVKGGELTKEQMANLSKGLRELFDILNKKNNTTINSIVAKMATIDTGVVHLDIDDWMLKQMTENQDIFDKMLENNGWQTIKDRSVELRNIDNKKKMQDDAAAALALIFDLEGFALEVKTNINFSTIKGNVSDKPSIMNRINVILSKYPCLSESDFIFETAYKSDKEDYWWVRYLINSTDIKGAQLYFIGKGGKLYDDIVAYNGELQLEYNNTFNTNFPNCVSKSTNKKRLNVKTTKIPTNTIKH